jgi:internalin A
VSCQCRPEAAIEKDSKFREQLGAHLALLTAQHTLQLWNDRAILAGADWAKEINKNLEVADLVLLLISADFMASRYCYGIEMKRALERHQARTAQVVPILVRACDLKDAPLKHLQWLPKGSKPVKSWRDRDEAWKDVATGIRRLVKELEGVGTRSDVALGEASDVVTWT